MLIPDARRSGVGAGASRDVKPEGTRLQKGLEPQTVRPGHLSSHTARLIKDPVSESRGNLAGSSLESRPTGQGRELFIQSFCLGRACSSHSALRSGSHSELTQVLWGSSE